MTEEIADLLTSGIGDQERHIHLFPIRVYYEDTDAEGIVYHANYLKFAERARTEMLRLSGREQFRMMADEGIGFAVRQCLVDFFRPAHLDDVLEVRTTIREVAGASLRLQQDIHRNDDLVAGLKVRLAVMNRQGRPVRLPQDIRDSLTPHVIEKEPPSARSA
jgi:acyl-CoA thioester hydrolase